MSSLHAAHETTDETRSLPGSYTYSIVNRVMLAAAAAPHILAMSFEVKELKVRSSIDKAVRYLKILHRC